MEAINHLKEFHSPFEGYIDYSFKDEHNKDYIDYTIEMNIFQNDDRFKEAFKVKFGVDYTTVIYCESKEEFDRVYERCKVFKDLKHILFVVNFTDKINNVKCFAVNY